VSSATNATFQVAFATIAIFAVILTSEEAAVEADSTMCDAEVYIVRLVRR
jgi:hypothetical protein